VTRQPAKLKPEVRDADVWRDESLAWRLRLGVGALAIVVVYYLLSPLAGAALNLVVGALASVAILAGLRWHRPPGGRPGG
jgi:hypothetical protein